MPRDKKRRDRIVVRSGSVEVPVYHSWHGPYHRYTVRYYIDGQTTKADVLRCIQSESRGQAGSSALLPATSTMCR